MTTIKMLKGEIACINQEIEEPKDKVRDLQDEIAQLEADRQPLIDQVEELEEKEELKGGKS